MNDTTMMRTTDGGSVRNRAPKLRQLVVAGDRIGAFVRPFLIAGAVLSYLYPSLFVVKHPLYTAVSLLVLPSAGLLLCSWLGVFIGIPLYVAARLYARTEERSLAETFGAAWDEYCGRVMIPWL